MEGIQEYREIEVLQIGRCPWQPRKRIGESDFDELVASVKSKGVLEPILVRPVKPYKETFEGFPSCGQKVSFQLIFGERRLRALWKAFQGTIGDKLSAVIPSMLREMSDEDAFDATTIENLHRKDLNELEEAESFRAYLDRRGDESVKTLAERIGVHPRYIFRKVRLLRLPSEILDAWGEGKIDSGYLGQLMRIADDEKLTLDVFHRILGNSWEFGTVKSLKEWIDERSPSLKRAKWKLKDEGCLNCNYNSIFQEAELGLDAGDLHGAHCLNPGCYKEKQGAWFLVNWEKTSWAQEIGTRGFRFRTDIGFQDMERWWKGKPRAKCRQCESFVTLLTLEGKQDADCVCIGPKDCFRKSQEKKGKGRDQGEESGEEAKAEAPRVAWHAQYFLNEYCMAEIKARLDDKSMDDEIMQRLLLGGLLNTDDEFNDDFARRHQAGDETWDSRRYIPTWQAWPLVSAMEAATLRTEISKGTRILAMKFAGIERLKVAPWLGAVLEQDFRLTKEYLDKKTISDIHAIAEEFGLWERKEAKAFLYEVLLKKRGAFKSCKKDELVRILLESGMDLRGVVPKEIREAAEEEREKKDVR